jgi:KUP system potassium uptake protein
MPFYRRHKIIKNNPVEKDKTLNIIKLAIGALGIVYGDLGTSCLYTIKESFNPVHGLALVETNVFGVCSLIFWTLLLVVIVKYITFVMRADNAGEGGMMALISIILNENKIRKIKVAGILIILGIFGTCLLLSEGILTPSITVLSAIEGLEVITPDFKPFIVPITIVILIGLFLLQKRGTGGIGAIFGPIMICWFLFIGFFGLMKILQFPVILKAFNPFYAVNFFIYNKLAGFFLLGSVVLCITGGEALYADMGHFGKKPIKIAWVCFVFPCLLLNYFGQGANLLMEGVRVLANPFYSLTGGWTIYPMIVIATLASIIASQALISGAFSLAQQAMQLGFVPRLNIIHTSFDIHGQIYIPEINTMLMLACVALVAIFKSSSNLASAYGMSVMGAMTITSLLITAVAIRRWKWKPWKAFCLMGLFLSVDLPYLCANLMKFFHGAWLPLTIASSIFILMNTWKKGREYLHNFVNDHFLPVDLFMTNVESSNKDLHRVNGTAIFLTSSIDTIPIALLHHFKHNKVLHEKIILLSVEIEKVPEVKESKRISIKKLDYGFYQIATYFGYMEKPDIPMILKKYEKKIDIDADGVSYYLGRETLLTTGDSKLMKWQKSLFAFLSKNARPASTFFKLPSNRVIELGVQVEI